MYRYALKACEDGFGAFGPDERLGGLIVLADITNDCIMEVSNGIEQAPLQVPIESDDIASLEHDLDT